MILFSVFEVWNWSHKVSRESRIFDVAHIRISKRIPNDSDRRMDRVTGAPRIWRVVNGRRKMPNGEIPRFSIQEVPEELFDDVVDFLVKYFLTEEQITYTEGK